MKTFTKILDAAAVADGHVVELRDGLWVVTAELAPVTPWQCEPPAERERRWEER